MRHLLPVWLMALVLAIPVQAQEVRVVEVESLPTSLAGEWLFRPGHDPAWASPFRERRGWQVVTVPGPWERQGHRGYDGHGWYRIQLFIPAHLAGEEIGLDLGLVADVDEVFLNGRLMAATGSFPPRLDLAGLNRRIYRVPRDMIRYGDRNEMAIRVYNDAQAGGLLGPGPQLHRMSVLQSRLVWREAAFFSLATLFLLMALLQAWLFSKSRERIEHLFFALFAVAAAAHALTHANWGVAALLGHSGNYRVHAASLLAGTALVPPVFFRLAKRSTPFPILVLQGVLGLGAVFSLVWRADADLFVWVLAANLAIVFLAVVFLRLLFRMLGQKQPLARIILVTVPIFVVTIIIDFLTDSGPIARTRPLLLEILAPFGVAPVSTAVCLSLLQGWVLDRCGDAGETASGILPWDRFLATLGRELDRSRRSGNPLTVSLMRITRGGIDLAPDVIRGEAVALLRRSLRHMDTLAHVGEGTLCLLLPETDERTAMATLERLRRTINTGPLAQGSRLATTAGVAEFRPIRHITAGELVQEAESALYAAVNEGGNCTATAP